MKLVDQGTLAQLYLKQNEKQQKNPLMVWSYASSGKSIREAVAKEYITKLFESIQKGINR